MREIGAALHVSAATVCREIKRGTYTYMNADYIEVTEYIPERSHQRYRANMEAKGPGLKIGSHRDYAEKLEELIVDQDYSPSAALHEIENHPEIYGDFGIRVCRQTLYSYVDKRIFARLTNKDLPFKGARRKKKTQHIRRMKTAPKGDSIEKRPEEVNTRQEPGHWEMDLVVSCRGGHKCLLVLTERVTRYEIIMKMPNRKAATVVQYLDKLERRYGKKFRTLFKSITVDNGSEFAAAGQSASIGNVESLKDAIASLGTGDGKIQHLQMTLSEDITLSDSDIASGFAPAGTSVGMDLAGHTMNLDASVIADNSSIAFFDGTILTQNLSAVNSDALSVGTNGTLTLDGITLESNGSGVGVIGATSGGTLTVRNSKITTAAYGVATNASAPVSENVTITLENSEFTGSDPVFINIPCTLNMTGCTLNGNMHGMVIRGGTANVENCHISLTYPENELREDAKRMADYFQSTNWATGNAVNIAAVTVGNKVAEGNPSYKYPSILNIKNCVVESAGIHADLFPALYVWANQETENGVTITYDGDTKFYGARIYGNNGANITVNGAAAVSDEGDTRP